MDRVLEELHKLEEKHNITVVFACDAGSRSYGCSTESSDYDVRFVYVKNNIRDYITVGEHVQSIVTFTDDHVVDLSGWDITKAVMHLKESNPSILEWLSSPIVYVDTRGFKQGCLDISKDMHSHLSLMYHYFHMAQNNWKIWLDGKDEVICKKYFYVIRPLASLIYIMDKYINHPDEPLQLLVNFDDLIDSVVHTLTPELYTELKNLIERKRHLSGTEICQPISNINEWIIGVFKQFEDLTRKDKSEESDIDLKVQSTIKTHKKLVNESKKIKDITNACGYTARTNYLTTIGLALQLLWLDANPEKETREMPIQIHHLLKTLEIDHVVRSEIRNIIDNLAQENKLSEARVTLEDVHNTFVKPGIAFLCKNNGTENISKLNISEKLQTLITTPKRHDYTEFAVKNFLELLWLLGNVEENQSSRPKDIIGVGDLTNTLPKEMLLEVKKTVAELRPKYIVSKNHVLEEWFRTILLDFETKVKMSQDRLIKIREINSQKRLKNSVKRVEPVRFDALIWNTIGI